MRVTKLVIGILMIVYSVWLFIQGLLGGFLGIIAEKNMVAGIIGVLLCGLFMASGFYAGLIWTGILALVIGIGFFVWHLKTR